MDTSNPHQASFLGGNWITDFVSKIYISVNHFYLKLILEKLQVWDWLQRATTVRWIDATLSA